MGKGDNRRPVAYEGQQSDLPQLPRQKRVLELPAGKGLCQVSPSQGVRLLSDSVGKYFQSTSTVSCLRLNGGYRALDMGFPHEAMVDMTGGITEVLTISSLPKDLPAFLAYLLSKGALINCANCQVQFALGSLIMIRDAGLPFVSRDCVCTFQGPLEQRNGLGIMFRHAYSLTAVEKVNVPSKVSIRETCPNTQTEAEG